MNLGTKHLKSSGILFMNKKLSFTVHGIVSVLIEWNILLSVQNYLMINVDVYLYEISVLFRIIEFSNLTEFMPQLCLSYLI